MGLELPRPGPLAKGNQGLAQRPAKDPARALGIVLRDLPD